MAATTSTLLAHIVDLKRKLGTVELERERLQNRLWASIESLAQENLKYGTLVDPSSPVLKGVSKSWQKILGYFIEARHFRAQDVIFASRRLHKDEQLPRIQTSGSARFQLAALEKKGVLKRLGGGNYKLLDRAKTELYPAPRKTAEPAHQALASVAASDAR